MKISRSKKWVSDQMLDALLRHFEACTELSDHGLVFRSHDYKELYEILPDAFAIAPAVSRSEAIRLFSRALLECRRAATMNAGAIIESAATIHRKALAAPNVRYTLWTKFRARDMAFSTGFTLAWRGTRLRTAAHLPAWLHRDEYLLSGVGRIYPRKPDFFGHVILTCDDRNEDRAVDRMTDALQLMLGLLNLYETWRQRIYFGGRSWTEGKLWPGPYQFVFQGKVFRGEDRVWFNPDYDEEAWDRFPPQIARVLQVVPWARKALAALHTHPLCDVLVRAILLLQDGFATRDSSYRLLRYWSALEQLYVEPDAKGRSNDKVLERALFAEPEPELSKWKLEHIARLRNDYVHAGVAGDDLIDMCQFLRELLARHINHWIFHGQDLAGHAALLQLVKLPSDRTSLAKMRKMIDRRLAYFNEAPPPPDRTT